MVVEFLSYFQSRHNQVHVNIIKRLVWMLIQILVQPLISKSMERMMIIINQCMFIHRLMTLFLRLKQMVSLKSLMVSSFFSWHRITLHKRCKTVNSI